MTDLNTQIERLKDAGDTIAYKARKYLKSGDVVEVWSCRNNDARYYGKITNATGMSLTINKSIIGYDNVVDITPYVKSEELEKLQSALADKEQKLAERERVIEGARQALIDIAVKEINPNNTVLDRMAAKALQRDEFQIMANKALQAIESGVKCKADRDGDCTWSECPQLRDNEPKTSHRHCPLDKGEDDD
jgi:hypothetical protein